MSPETLSLDCHVERDIPETWLCSAVVPRRQSFLDPVSPMHGLQISYSTMQERVSKILRLVDAVLSEDGLLKMASINNNASMEASSLILEAKDKDGANMSRPEGLQQPPELTVT